MSIKMTRGKGYLKRFKVYAQLTSKNGIIGMIARIVTGKTHYRCLQCLVAGGADSENFMPCLTPSCGAFYCFDCLPYLKNQCRKCSRQYTVVQELYRPLNSRYTVLLPKVYGHFALRSILFGPFTFRISILCI